MISLLFTAYVNDVETTAGTTASGPQPSSTVVWAFLVAAAAEAAPILQHHATS